MRRVVITGLGTMNALGLDVESSWSRMLRAESGVGPITRFDTAEQTVKFAASIVWDPLKYFSTPDLRKLDPFTMWALVATDEALRDGGLEPLKESEERRERWGCILGTGIGGITGIEEQHHGLIEKGPRRVSPHFVPKIMANAVSGQVAIRHTLLGTCFTTSSACASAGHAMGMAWRAIQLGDADLIVTGGSESATTPMSLAGFANMKALSTRNDDPQSASRPFDKDRDGFVMGEGCGILVFEELEHARARGAKIYAEVKGFGSTDDGHHITAPEESGKGPARAIKQVFGAHAKQLAVSSTKSMIGHLLGASAAVELVVTALSVRQGVIHPTRNYTTPDPDCDLDYVPGSARSLKVRNAISNSLGFGGHNVSILIGQPD